MTTTASTSARPSATVVIASLALALSTLAIGVLIGKNISPTAVASQSNNPAGPVDLRPVVAELHQLIDAVQRHAAAGATDLQREQAGSGELAPSSGVPDRLVAAVDQLNRTLESRGTGGDSGPRTDDSRWKGAGFPTLELLWDHIGEQIGQVVAKGDGNAKASICRDLSRAHLLWARGDVLDRYGVPDATWGDSNGLSFFYAKKLADEHSVSIAFRMQNGMVGVVEMQ